MGMGTGGTPTTGNLPETTEIFGCSTDNLPETTGNIPNTTEKLGSPTDNIPRQSIF
jgi:hypothetical protein